MKILLIVCLFICNLWGFEFVPDKIDRNTPIVFVLHGCKQDANEFIKDNYLIEKANGKVAIYAPSQSTMYNIDKCWNWFMPKNQSRSSFSETNHLLEGLTKFKHRNNLNSNPVYLMGFSAGAAQTMNFLACYPNEFKGALVHSGLAYRVSNNIWDINDVIAYGPKRPHKELIEDFVNCSKNNNKSYFDKKIIAFHGSRDFRVNIKNFYALEVQLVESFDYRDDGKRNNSFNFEKQVNSFLQDDYEYNYRSYRSGKLHLEFYEIDGLQHDWSGGDERRNRNDPRAISATDVLLKAIGL